MHKKASKHASKKKHISKKAAKPRSSKKVSKRPSVKKSKKSQRRHYAPRSPHPGQYYIPKFAGVGYRGCAVAGGVPRHSYVNSVGTRVGETCAAPKNQGVLGPVGPCYGKLKRGCGVDDGCHWTTRFENRFGTTVRGHCGLIPNRSSRSSTQVFPDRKRMDGMAGTPRFTIPSSASLALPGPSSASLALPGPSSAGLARPGPSSASLPLPLPPPSGYVPFNQLTGEKLRAELTRHRNMTSPHRHLNQLTGEKLRAELTRRHNMTPSSPRKEKAREEKARAQEKAREEKARAQEKAREEKARAQEKAREEKARAQEKAREEKAREEKAREEKARAQEKARQERSRENTEEMLREAEKKTLRKLLADRGITDKASFKKWMLANHPDKLGGRPNPDMSIVTGIRQALKDRFDVTDYGFY